jgi:hypothetical protein
MSVIYVTSFGSPSRGGMPRCKDNLNSRISPGRLDSMPRRKRQPSPKARQAQQHQRRQASAAESPGPAQRASRMSAEQLLERIGRVRVVHQEAEAELALLVDHAVGLGIGWPEIASRLGVSRQAARQQYQRRHRGDGSPEDGAA